MEPTKRCPYCAEEILAAAIRCRYCHSQLSNAILAHDETVAASPSVDSSLPNANYGWALLGLPIVGAVLLWADWIGGLTTPPWPAIAATGVRMTVVIGTAIVAALEAKKLGMTYNRAGGTYSPIQWAATLTFIWIIGYPVYLYKRRRFGCANLLFPGLIVTAIFIVSSVAVIEEIKQKEVESPLASEASQATKSQSDAVASIVSQKGIEEEPINTRPSTSSVVGLSNTVPTEVEAQSGHDDLPSVDRGDAPPTFPPPSFDCTKARSVAEHLICGDEELATLDREYEAVYVQARNAAPDEKEFIRRSRDEWLRREHECTEKSCLIEWYSTRKRELSALIEAASSIPIATNQGESR